MLVDLKQETDRKLKSETLSSKEGRRAWHYQFALHFQPRMRAFYDTDDDGQFDLILIGSPASGVRNVLRRDKDKWVHEGGKGGSVLDPEKIPDKAMRERFMSIFRNLLK